MKIKKPIKRDEIPVLNISYMVSSYFGLSARQMNEKTNKRAYVLPRQVYMYLLYKYTGMTLREVGSMCSKDYSTVIYSNQTIADLMQTDKVFKEKMKSLEDDLMAMFQAGKARKEQPRFCTPAVYGVQILRTIGK